MTLAPATVLLAHIDIPPQLAASLVVLGIMLVIWFFKSVFSRKPAGPVVAAGAPNCPTCRRFARWYPAANHWRCDRCNQVVAPPGAPAMPIAGPPINPYTGQPIAPQMQTPQGPTCAACGGPGRWLAESNAWGCDRCRQLIQPR